MDSSRADFSVTEGGCPQRGPHHSPHQNPQRGQKYVSPRGLKPGFTPTLYILFVLIFTGPLFADSPENPTEGYVPPPEKEAPIFKEWDRENPQGARSRGRDLDRGHSQDWDLDRGQRRGQASSLLSPAVASGTIGALGVAAGIAISVFGVSQTANSVDQGFFSKEMQKGIHRWGSGMLISSLSAVLIQWARSGEARSSTPAEKHTRSEEPPRSEEQVTSGHRASRE